MAEDGRLPQPTELVYLPEPSWKPLFVATGLASMAVGMFAGWVWLAAGAVLVLASARGWIADVAAELRRLPRRQRLTTGVIPATPLRGASRRPGP
jgi:hypothetical protein